jgi:hypothetical protein
MATAKKQQKKSPKATQKAPKPDWQAIEVEYTTTAIEYDDLAAKHGVKPATLRQRASRGGWIEKRRTLSQKVTEQATVKAVKSRTQELSEYNDADIKVAKAIRTQIAKAINRAQQSDKEVDPAKLRAMAGALESAQRVARLAMGATTANTGISDPNGGPVKYQEMPDDEIDARIRELTNKLGSEASLANGSG